MALSKRLRFEVFKRDRFTCTYCGRRPPEVLLEADHIVPKCEGGPDTLENLTTSCEPCNRGKAGRPLGAVAPAVNEMAVLEAIQEMGERARSLRSQIAAAEATRNALADAVITVMDWWEDIGGNNDDLERNSRNAASIRRFLRDLSMDDLRHAIEVTGLMWDRNPHTSQDSAFRYFAGVCWRTIKDQEGRN